MENCRLQNFPKMHFFTSSMFQRFSSTLNLNILMKMLSPYGIYFQICDYFACRKHNIFWFLQAPRLFGAFLSIHHNLENVRDGTRILWCIMIHVSCYITPFACRLRQIHPILKNSISRDHPKRKRSWTYHISKASRFCFFFSYNYFLENCIKFTLL